MEEEEVGKLPLKRETGFSFSNFLNCGNGKLNHVFSSENWPLLLLVDSAVAVRSV